MKKKVLIIIALCVILIGSAVIAFPFISIYFNDVKMEEEVKTFDKSVVNIIEDKDHTQLNLDDEGYLLNEKDERISEAPVYTKPDLDRLYRAMQAYNANLREHQQELLIDESSYVNPCFNLADYGIYNNSIGYISAPAINMEIPIYLGANDYNMEYGATHLTYTSLPLGEIGSNVVLSAHTGYIGRVFFDNLPSLNAGDSVYIHSFWGTYEYKVVSKEIAESDDISKLFINKEKDLLTLITCHQKSVGVYNRWILVCERV